MEQANAFAVRHLSPLGRSCYLTRLLLRWHSLQADPLQVCILPKLNLCSCYLVTRRCLWLVCAGWLAGVLPQGCATCLMPAVAMHGSLQVSLALPAALPLPAWIALHLFDLLPQSLAVCMGSCPYLLGACR